MEERIIRLEENLFFLEEQIKNLDGQLVNQQAQLDSLDKKMELIQARLTEVLECFSVGQSSAEKRADPLPPHHLAKFW